MAYNGVEDVGTSASINYINIPSGCSSDVLLYLNGAFGSVLELGGPINGTLEVLYRLPFNTGTD